MCYGNKWFPTLIKIISSRILSCNVFNLHHVTIQNILIILKIALILFYAECCLIFKWNMTLTGFCQYLCDSPVCLVFTSNLPHITEYCIRVWSCHVTWAVLHVHLVEGVLCVRRVRCVSYWGCVRMCERDLCVSGCNGPCVCEMEGVSVSCGSVGYIFSHNSSRSQVTPVFSRTYFAFFPSPVYHTPSSGFGRQIFPPLRLQNSLFLSRNPSLFPLTQLGRDCRDYRLLVTVMCVCVYSLLQL